jgi:hypothetical protein
LRHFENLNPLEISDDISFSFAGKTNLSDARLALLNSCVDAVSGFPRQVMMVQFR